MALKRGLGKGLDSLIPTNVMMESEVKHATVSTASSAEEEKRRHSDGKAVKGRAESGTAP